MEKALKGEDGLRKLTLGSLVVPILFENILRNLMGTVNVFMLSRYSDTAVGAVGVANQYIIMLTMLINLISTGSVVAVNYAIGGGSRIKAERIATAILAVNVSLGVAFGLACVFLNRPLLAIMSLEPALMNDARTYMYIAGGLMVFQSAVMGLSVINRCFGFTRMPLVVSIIMNVINIAGNAVVIFRPFEVPLYGVSGVAAVLVFSQLLGFIIMAVLTVKNGIGIKLQYLRPFPFAELKSALSVGVPAMMDGLSYNISQILTTAFITVLGAEAVSAKIYVQSIVFFVYVTSISVGQAGQILVAQKTGAGEYEETKRTANRCLRICITSNLSLSALAIILRVHLLSIFTSDPKIIAIAAPIFFIDFFVEGARSVNNVMLGMLRGTGDVKVSTTINVICMWIFSVGLSWVFGIGLGWGLAGIWAAFAVDETVRGTFMLIRWYSGKWREIAELRVRRLNESAPQNG